jgi:hypothetical protein
MEGNSVNGDQLSVKPVEIRDLPWISALLQKMVDINFSRYVSNEQIELIVSQKCSQKALTEEMGMGNQFIKLVYGDDIQGIASYKEEESPVEIRVDNLYALPGEHEALRITLLVNYMKERAGQIGYKLLSLSLPPGDGKMLQLLTDQGFTVKGVEKVEVVDNFQLDAYVLTAELKN